MDELANSRAQSAQQLAQQMGGPVSVGEFMSGVEPARSALAQIAPNQLLHGLANAQAGVQQARAFSEQVFPAMRTEEVAKARNYFEDQIAQLRKQIDQINASSSSTITKRFRDLQQQEFENKLEVAKARLDELKANRDWEATKRTLNQSARRQTLAEKEFGFGKKKFGKEFGLAVTKQKQYVQLSKMKLTSAQKIAASKLGMTALQYKETMRHHMATEAAANARIQAQRQKNAMSLIDHATGRTQGPMTITRRRELDAATAAMRIGDPKIQIVKDKKGKTHFYINENVTLTPGQVNRQYGSMGVAADPQSMYDYLIGNNVSAAMAKKVVRMKSGLHDFTPGKPLRYSYEDLHRVADRSFQELVGIAKRRGYVQDKKHPKNTQQIIEFIIGKNP
jgi:hypothetical protein